MLKSPLHSVCMKNFKKFLAALEPKIAPCVRIIVMKSHAPLASPHIKLPKKSIHGAITRIIHNIASPMHRRESIYIVAVHSHPPHFRVLNFQINSIFLNDLVRKTIPISPSFFFKKLCIFNQKSSFLIYIILYMVCVCQKIKAIFIKLFL